MSKLLDAFAVTHRFSMNYTLFHFAFIKLKASDTMETGKQTHEMIAVARKGPLEDLKGNITSACAHTANAA